jgi:hypothetical protein
MRATSPRIAWVGAAAALAAALGQPARAAPPQESSDSILGAHAPAVLRLFQSEGLVVLKELSPEGRIMALVRFEQPRRRVIRLLSQTARHDEFRPELKRIESHRWDERGSLDTHYLRIMFMKIDYRLRTNFDWEGNRIWWELDPEFDNGFDVVEGYWELFDLDGRSTLGRFGAKVDVSPKLPSWLQDSVTRKNVPAAMVNVKRWIDSDGKYRP